MRPETDPPGVHIEHSPRLRQSHTNGPDNLSPSSHGLWRPVVAASCQREIWKQGAAMKRSPLTIGVLLGCAAIVGVAASAQAGVVYIGEAIFDGSGTDKSGLAPGIPGLPGTTTLEDGVSRNN